MTRSKLVRRRNCQFLPAVEPVEERIFPGQTLGFLGDFSSPTAATIDSVHKNIIGGGYGSVPSITANDLGDTSLLSIAPIPNSSLLPQVSGGTSQTTIGTNPTADGSVNLGGSDATSLAFGGSTAFFATAEALGFGFGSISIAGEFSATPQMLGMIGGGANIANVLDLPALMGAGGQARRHLSAGSPHIRQARHAPATPPIHVSTNSSGASGGLTGGSSQTILSPGGGPKIPILIGLNVDYRTRDPFA